VRGKLFSLSPDNQWKERGTGSLKLNVRILDGGGARLGEPSVPASFLFTHAGVTVMRKEAVYTVILNITLFRGMRCFLSSDPRYIRFSAIEDGRTTHYNLRVGLCFI
jgi:Ran-binding protein 3